MGAEGLLLFAEALTLGTVHVIGTPQTLMERPHGWLPHSVLQGAGELHLPPILLPKASIFSSQLFASPEIPPVPARQGKAG